jgi:hypothetical protein
MFHVKHPAPAIPTGDSRARKPAIYAKMFVIIKLTYGRGRGDNP